MYLDITRITGKDIRAKCFYIQINIFYIFKVNDEDLSKDVVKIEKQVIRAKCLKLHILRSGTLDIFKFIFLAQHKKKCFLSTWNKKIIIYINPTNVFSYFALSENGLNFLDIFPLQKKYKKETLFIQNGHILDIFRSPEILFLQSPE